jgi:hypothetical protein
VPSPRVDDLLSGRGDEALKIVKLVILITDTLSLNVVIFLLGDLRAQYITDAAGAIIFRSGGVVLLRCIRKTRVPAVSSSCERFWRTHRWFRPITSDTNCSPS